MIETPNTQQQYIYISLPTALAQLPTLSVWQSDALKSHVAVHKG